MACFLVPATEAIVTTIVAKAVKSHEAKKEEQTKVKTLSEDKLPLSKKIKGSQAFCGAAQDFWHLNICGKARYLRSSIPDSG